MILASYVFVPPVWLPQFAAIEESEKIQQEPVQLSNAVKEPVSSIRPSQEDFSPAALKAALEVDFSTYRISDRLPEGQYTIAHESTWYWDAKNSKSKGVAAFTPDTWYDYCRQFGKYEDIDPYQQLKCFSYMWSIGLDWRWDAYCLHYYDLDCINKRNIYPIK